MTRMKKPGQFSQLSFLFLGLALTRTSQYLALLRPRCREAVTDTGNGNEIKRD